MIGLVILIVGVVYLITLFFVTRFAYRWAKARGLTTGKCWLAAASGFLLVYLLAFWDHIPTVVAHKYYCEKEAGFWVYKTAEQWKKENPGVLESLPASGHASRYERFDEGRGKTDTYFFNGRINWIVIHHDISTLLPIMRIEQQVKDDQTSEVLARYVDFATGNSVRNTVGPPGPMRFWLNTQYCSEASAWNKDKLSKFLDQFDGIKK